MASGPLCAASNGAYEMPSDSPRRYYLRDTGSSPHTGRFSSCCSQLLPVVGLQSQACKEFTAEAATLFPITVCQCSLIKKTTLGAAGGNCWNESLWGNSGGTVSTFSNCGCCGSKQKKTKPQTTWQCKLPHTSVCANTRFL